jgi:hypothetical protein
MIADAFNDVTGSKANSGLNNGPAVLDELKEIPLT